MRAKMSFNTSLSMSSLARAPRPIAASSLSSVMGFGALPLLHRRRRRRVRGIRDRLRGRARHLVLMALARDLEVQESQLFLQFKPRALERQLRVELHLLMRRVEIGRASCRERG